MKKTAAAIIIIAGACAFLFAAVPAREVPMDKPSACSVDNQTSAGYILLSLPGREDVLTRPAVSFNHEKHVCELGERACADCHAKQTDGSLVFEFPKNLPDTDDPDALMHAWHDGCIGCHSERAQRKESSGPLTCGECHIKDRKAMAPEFVHVLPSYYEPLRDTYHADCRACHSEPVKKAEHAPVLDWKKFHVLRGSLTEPKQPPSGFDYQRHFKHTSALEKDCGLCHYLSPEKRVTIEKEGKEPECRDWLLEPDPQGSWREQDYAHSRCVNCHFARVTAGEEKAGPLVCSGCHTHEVRTPEQMRDIGRPDCEQKDKILISYGDATVMDAVPFNHAEHQLRTTSCQDCHHNGLQACRECHTPTGDEKGDFVTLAQAYHREHALRSCVGCHSSQKQKGECAGCHQQLPGTLTSKSSCISCHSGSLAALERTRRQTPPENLIASDVKASWNIEKMGDTYKQVQFNHMDMVKALAAVCETSPLARHFHADDMTVCAACHHHSPLVPGKPVPSCRTCHDAQPTGAASRPDLMGAYHQQCLGCHQRMGGTEEKMPQTCDGCHAAR